MKSFKKVLKIIGKILLIFIVVLVASSIISSVPFTDKLFAEIYMLRFGTDAEYVGEEIEYSVYLMSKKEYRKKTYYDKKNDFEFHLYCGDVLLKNRVTSDDYYKYKLRKEAEDILVEEILEPVLENEYFVVVKSFGDATKKDNLENTVTLAYVFTWSESDYDDIGKKVTYKIKTNEKIKKGGGIQLFICEDANQYLIEKNNVDMEDEEELGYGMQWYVPDDKTILYDTIIHCYDIYDKWINAR